MTGNRNQGRGRGGRGGSRHSKGLTLASAAFLFLLLRLFAVTRYEWHTAFAVLHAIDLNDGVGIVLGTLMADAPAALLVVAVLLPISVFRLIRSLTEIWEARRHPGEPHDPVPFDLGAGVVLTISLVAVVTYVRSFHVWWVLLLACVIGGLLFVIGYGVRSGGRPRRAAMWASRHFGALVVTAMLVSAATAGTPWVPLERIGVRGEGTLRGYVMQAEPGFLKLLTEREREFLILTDQAVVSRVELERH